MKKLANIYIVLFLLDGIISMADVLSARFFGTHAFHVARGMIAFFPFILAFPLYCIMGCMRGFPRRVLLPMVIFIAWACLFASLPLPFFLGLQRTDLLLSVMQSLLGVVALLALHRSNQNRSWLYESAAFEPLRFSGKRLCGFVAANVFLIIPLLGLYLGVSASIGIGHLSKNFIQLSAKGISVESRTYRYKDKKILLLPTVHIAKHSFYSDLMEGLPSENTVIIPEGVTDRKNHLANGMGYEKLAPAMGLKAQDIQPRAADFPTNSCDIDVDSLSPDVVEYLKAISHLFNNINSENRSMALIKYITTPAPDTHLLLKEILENRNRRVVACVLESVENYDYVVVPWGAAHMPGIEQDLLTAGAMMVDSRRVWIVQWIGASNVPRNNGAEQ